MNSDVLATMDPRQLGQRLQAAREARGLTQQQAADHLEVARTTLTAMEKGTRRVRPDELVKLAHLYGRTVSELLRRGERPAAFAVQLRAARAPTSEDAEMDTATFEFQRLCEDYLELEQLCQAPLIRNYPPVRFIGKVAPERVAEDLAVAERLRLGLGDGPLLNLRDVLENDVGLRIFYLDLPSGVAAMFAYSELLGGCIAVNRNQPEERRRMSIGHEYGHFLTRRYQPEVTLFTRYQRQPEHERFAEAFARAFLLPSTGLSRRFHELHRSREGKITPADLLTLADLYHVSAEALTRRLEELDLVERGTWEGLKRAGLKVREAQAILRFPGRPVNDEQLPTRYRYLAVEAYQRGELSEGQFARFLRVDRLEARRVAQELSRSADRSDDNDDDVPLDMNETLSTGGK